MKRVGYTQDPNNIISSVFMIETENEINIISFPEEENGQYTFSKKLEDIIWIDGNNLSKIFQESEKLDKQLCYYNKPDEFRRLFEKMSIDDLKSLKKYKIKKSITQSW